MPTLADTQAVFDALSHEARREIVVILAQLGGELPSGYLAGRFPHSWPTTTRHLNILQKARIIEVRREGRSAHYRLNHDFLEEVVGGWLVLAGRRSNRQKWTSPGVRTVGELAAEAERSAHKSKKK
jgi:DNA-binding transcriptional ArsR family regulator